MSIGVKRQMNNSLINICYEGDSGQNDIRTLYSDGILHISLSDVMVTLNKENRELNEQHIPKHMIRVIRSIITDLDNDEYITIPTTDSRGTYDEYFITQPGLNRVMSSDKSIAGKKFQRWLYHDVIPSLTQYKTYPPPSKPTGSPLSQLAEQQAQTSRSLADLIVKQEELQQNISASNKKFEIDMTGVKTDITDVNVRIGKLEEKDLDNPYISTIGKWLSDNGYDTEGKDIELLSWCENLTINSPQEAILCSSGIRENKKFPIDIIKDAFSRTNRVHQVRPKF